MKSTPLLLSLLTALPMLAACVGDYPELPEKYQNKAPSIKGLETVSLTEGTINRVDLTITDDRNTVSELDIEWSITTEPEIDITLVPDSSSASVDIPWLADDTLKATLTVTATDVEGESTQASVELEVLKQRLLVVQAEKERQGDGDLYRVGYPEANPQRLTDPIAVNESIEQVKLSPNGQRLAFVRRHSSEADTLMLAETNSGSKASIGIALEATESIRQLRWSTSGRWLAMVTATSGTSPVFRLHLLDTNEGQAPRETVLPLLNENAYDWSNDESQLAYHNRQSRLVWLNLTDDTSHTVYDPADTGVAGAPPFVWHPDDSVLAYLGAATANGSKAVFIAQPDEAAITVVAVSTRYGTHVASLSKLTWSPEGSFLTYLGDLQSSGVVELFNFYWTDYQNGTEAAAAQVKVSGNLVSAGDVSDYIWNPDETRLAYKADQLEDGKIQLFASGFDGGSNRQLTDLSGTLTDLFWGWTETGELLYGYSRFEGALPYRITLLVIDAQSQLSNRAITDALSSASATQALGNILLSPDRQWLAIPSFTAATQQTNVYVLNIAEERLSQLSALNNHETDTTFAWSPNSDGVLYLTLDDDDIGQRLVFQPLATLPEQQDNSLMGELAPNGTIHQFQIAR